MQCFNARCERPAAQEEAAMLLGLHYCSDGQPKEEFSVSGAQPGQSGIAAGDAP